MGPAVYDEWSPLGGNIGPLTRPAPPTGGERVLEMKFVSYFISPAVRSASSIVFATPV